MAKTVQYRIYHLLKEGIRTIQLFLQINLQV